MAHAIGGNFGRHSGLQHGSQPGGWQILGLVAAVAAAIGLTLTQSSLFEARDQAPSTAPLPNVIIVGAEATSLLESVPQDTLAGPTAAPTDNELTAAAVLTVEETAVPVRSFETSPNVTIQDIDLITLPFLQSFARQLYGRVDAAGVNYIDVTLDGEQEAIVPITSDGTYGNLGYAVMTLKAGEAEPVLIRTAGAERRGLVLSYEGGQLTETSGVYGPTDANCCPRQIVTTYYQWNGTALVAERTSVITIPQGPKAN